MPAPSNSTNSVQAHLLKAGFQTQVIELPESTRSAVEASNSIGCAISQIVKSLIFKTKFSQKPVLILASGHNQVDESLISTYIEEEIVKADANYVRAITGYAIGGIPPVAHKEKIEFIFIDKDLLNCDVVWAAAGTPRAVFAINIKDLVTLTQGRVACIAKS